MLLSTAHIERFFLNLLSIHRAAGNLSGLRILEGNEPKSTWFALVVKHNTVGSDGPKFFKDFAELLLSPTLRKVFDVDIREILGLKY